MSAATIETEVFKLPSISPVTLDVALELARWLIDNGLNVRIGRSLIEWGDPPVMSFGITVTNPKSLRIGRPTQWVHVRTDGKLERAS